MREWKLGAGDPLHLVLAADARLCTPDYTNDHIWELSLGGGEPPALLLHTTYGLRAGWMRLFPRFVRAGVALTDPSAFAGPPRVLRFAPNYILLEFAPFSGIDVQCEYWVPDSHTIAGRMTVANTSVLRENLRVEWAALLSPLDRGEAMSVMAATPSPVLAGHTEDLAPVCALAGTSVAPVNSPFPALAVDFDLYPGATRVIGWAQASLEECEASLEAARALAAAPWDAPLARISMLARQHMVHIHSGEPDWDAAFAFTQAAALRLFMTGPQLPYPSFVQSRGPDRGFSPRGDGSDYPYAWSGQTAFGAWQLASLLPGAPDLVKGVLENFLHVQTENGWVDWKPGLGGQRGRHLAPPLLATLAWKLAQSDLTPAWLNEQYPRLARFFETWMDAEHDRDGDGFPEWDHPLQTGYESNPLFDRWHIESQGVDISTIESPALGALLYRECQSLIRIARQTGREADLPALETRAARLRALVEETWDDEAAVYRFRDFQTHRWTPGKLIKTFQGSGSTPFAHTFSTPQRLVVRVHSQEESTRAARVLLNGQSPEGEVFDELRPTDFFWMHGEGRATTRSTFHTLERVEISGLESRDRLRLYTVDFTQETVSLLLPLWAQMTQPAQAAALIEQTLTGRFLASFGIPMCPSRPGEEAPAHFSHVEMLWNTLIGEGLLHYGRQTEAAELVTRLMRAVTGALKSNRAFHQYYHAHTGQPSGDSNALMGLAPLGLFLQSLGLDRFSPNEVIVRGINPYPWPITVQYRGVTILRQGEETSVTFPTGKPVVFHGPGPYRLSLV